MVTRLIAFVTVLLLVLATACGGASSLGGDASQPTDASRSPRATSYVLDALDVNNAEWTDLPLGILAPGAVSYAEQFQQCCLAIAVALPDSDLVYTLDGDRPFELVSVGKVPLMLTLISQAEADDRDLTLAELGLIEEMITLSDNAAADAAWDLVGGKRGVETFLEAAGITDARIDAENWGEVQLSASGAAILLASVVDGQVLESTGRDLALAAMSRVAPWQDWGTTTGAPVDAYAGLKNGWYPEENGWVVNSLGYVIEPDGRAYTIAVFTFGQRDYYTAASTIESIARQVHFELAD